MGCAVRASLVCFAMSMFSVFASKYDFAQVTPNLLQLRSFAHLHLENQI
jgi:hypothetical protein